MSNPQGNGPGNKVSSINFAPLVATMNSLGSDVNKQIDGIRKKKDAMSIADVFELQTKMQKFTQFTDMSSAVASSLNQAISTMARNIK